MTHDELLIQFWEVVIWV